MLLELHLLQNFAPSNLNRDDTGSPKDCQFGGYTRARISSQCLKRAIRTDFKAHPQIMPSEHLAVRTKRIVDAIADRLEGRGRQREQAVQAATALVKSTGIGIDDASAMTKYLLFVSQGDIDATAAIAEKHWETVLAGTVPPEAKKELTNALDASRAVDLALFGRMIADRPESNVEAASQVAHAISTHQVSTAFDFYTAVDDLKPSDTAGADMLGTVEFNSACYYRYANVDGAALARNLAGDTELAQRTVWAFIHASVNAIPTGKQNSMAALNQASFVMAVVRESGAWNLANAFLRPARPRQDDDLMQTSIAQFDTYWNKLATMYGTQGIRWIGVATLEPESLAALKDRQVAAGSDGSQIAALARQATAATFAPATA